MEPVIVYKVTRESQPVVMELLKNEGLTPSTVDAPSPFVLYWHSGTYLINVAVPSEQAEVARLFLLKWEKTRQPDVKKTSRQLFSSFMLSIAVIIAIAALLLLLGRLLDFAALLFIIWIVVFALVSNIGRIMQKVRGRKT
jgi:hypothetical protein